MANFARAVWRGARDEERYVEFMALVEIVNRKGGKPTGFVLCRHITPADNSDKGRSEMIRIKAKNIEAEVMLFWPQGVEEERGFPDCQSDRWEKTTCWLHMVVVDSWYYFAPDIWVKVGRPRQRKKKPMQPEDHANATLVQGARLRQAEYLRDLKADRSRLQSRLEILEDCKNSQLPISVQKKNRIEHASIGRDIKRISDAITCATWEQPKIDSKFLKPIGRIPGSVRQVLTSR